ncbi:hypothetical protein [Chryseobacterium lathyri]|uniref:Uncharacterized protein n=1 Tax=Chryseobacterium lathyri TaxID=395933 RepID=A0ABT9SNT7_9FLAO|nr:hypothetical protein [Chryseobacterium lathyri]MDP9961099.1 hypothetical protein [Chryseobacterium lathyri]
MTTKNTNTAFIKLKPISTVPETTTMFNSWIVVDKGDGELGRMPVELFYQIIGNIAKPISPADPAPTVEGWYKPQTSSDDPGTNYPNAGNLKARKGYDTLFWYDGTIWKKTEVELPSTTAKQIYDAANDVDPATMKAANGKFGPSLESLNSFVTATKTEEAEITMPQSGEIAGNYLKGDFTTVTAAGTSYGQIPMTELSGYDRIVIKGNKQTGGNSMMYLGKKHANGTNITIVVGSQLNNTTDYIHEIDKTAQYYYYSRFGGTSVEPFITKFYKSRTVSDLQTDSVKSYIDPSRKVLDSFINPSETIWQEITMPYTDEHAGKYLDTGFNEQTGTAVAWGVIPNSEFDSEWTLLKMEGNFSLLGGIGMWLARTRNPAAGTSQILISGNQGAVNSFTFGLDPQYTGFAYSRVTPDKVKFYKGKVVKSGPVLDSVKSFILANGATARHRIIDAYTDFNVKPSNTAAVNSINLNAAIAAAFVEKKQIILPAGLIYHNGIEYQPGVIIRGQGITNTNLVNSGGTYAIRCLDEFNTNPLQAGGGIFDMAIVGANVADYGLNFRNMWQFKIENVWFSGFKVNSIKFEGVGACSINYVRVYGGKGFKILTSDTSEVGYLQANLFEYNFVYFENIPIAVEIDRGSDHVFRSCNFEMVGAEGNLLTGGVIATRMSPGGEGIDVTLENCWSETLVGPILNISNSNGGVSTIRDTMVGNPGNTAARTIVNNGGKLLITGSTKVTGSVLTQNNGVTRVDGFATITSHTEETGGTYKQAAFS